MNFIQKRYVLLAVTTTVCLFLLAGRIYVSGNLNFVFLVWNILLAWIPLYFSHKLKKSFPEKKTWLSMFLFLCWLAIFPNAPYILTDLIHLKQKAGVPLWFDLILLVSFAWNGLLTGFISLMEVHQTFLTRYSEKRCWGIISGILLLSGYGIYLGRFERWNSWDILIHPFRLINQMIENFQHQETLMRSIGVTFSFGIFLMISYGTLYFLNSKEEKAL
jgi:uncharacterized membrane protein